MSFTDDVKRFRVNTEKNIEVAAKQAAMLLFRKVIMRTPVGNRELWAVNDMVLLQRETYQVFRESVSKKRVSAATLEKGFKLKGPKGYVGGRARGNWQVNVGASTAAVATDTKDKDGNATVSAALGVMAEWKPSGGQIIWIGNALPYICRLEYDSWSSQAPAGMVRVSALEIRTGATK